MKYIEYAIYDLDLSEEELVKNIESAIEYGVDCISVPFASTKFCKNIVKNTKIKISNPIDYPLGISDIKTRNYAIENAIENGAEKIDVVMQNNYLNYKKYDKIRQDIRSNYEICSKYNVPINYYLEYRVFTHQSLIKACNVIMETPIDTVYASTGHMIDNLEDNLIATILLQEKTKINTIFTGNVWTKKHIELLIKNNISMLRFNTINSITTYLRFSSGNTNG